MNSETESECRLRKARNVSGFGRTFQAMQEDYLAEREIGRLVLICDDRNAGTNLVFNP